MDITFLFFSLFIFCFGLIVGSFLNAVIYRLKTKESLINQRSHCPRCSHKLEARDLVPIFSFLELKGKCRYCKKPISFQYPLVEIATALLFLLIFNSRFLISKQFLIFNFLNLFYYWIIASFLIVIFVYDLKHYIIPDEIVFPAIGTAFLYNVLYSYLILHTLYFVLYALYSALGVSLFFLVIFLFSKGKWIGFGDVKLAFLMGLFLGFPNIIVALFFAYLIGAIIGVGLIFSGKKGLKSEVPFGPFLVTGTFLALFWGEKIIHWYLNLFLLK